MLIVGRTSAEQPNIVILLADDLGYGEPGCPGNDQIPTPHIDSIAKRGVRFTSAYVTAPNCSPSRAGLLTGRIPMRFGYEFNPIGAKNEQPGIGLPASEKTLAEVLHDVGYTTGVFGKWHLGGSAEFHPFRHGFDEFYGFNHEGHYFVPPPWNNVTTMLRRKALPGNRKGRWTSERLIYSTHMGHDEPDYDANNPIVRGGQPVPEPDYLTDAITRESTDFIRRHRDKPFFLYVAYNAVHSPLQAKTSDLARLEHIDDIHRKIFGGMLLSLDDGVGKILQTLASEKLAEKTLLVFLSDNGGPTRELTSSNAPLRGEKGTMYEGGLRVPFLMSWPETIPQNQTVDAPVSSLDLFATACQISGADQPRETDGVNLLPALTGQTDWLPEREFYWRQGNRAALRVGKWKLVRGGTRRKATPWELYDLQADLGETNNLAGSNTDVLNTMIRLWEDRDAEMQPALFSQKKPQRQRGFRVAKRQQTPQAATTPAAAE